MYWAAFPLRITPSKPFPQGFPTRRFCICRFNRWCSLSLQNALHGRGNMGSLGSACILGLEIIGTRAMKQSESRSTVPLVLHSGKPSSLSHEWVCRAVGWCLHTYTHAHITHTHTTHSLHKHHADIHITHMGHTHYNTMHANPTHTTQTLHIHTHHRLSTQTPNKHTHHTTHSHIQHTECTHKHPTHTDTIYIPHYTHNTVHTKTPYTYRRNTTHTQTHDIQPSHTLHTPHTYHTNTTLTQCNADTHTTHHIGTPHRPFIYILATHATHTHRPHIYTHICKPWQHR